MQPMKVFPSMSGIARNMLLTLLNHCHPTPPAVGSSQKVALLIPNSQHTFERTRECSPFVSLASAARDSDSQEAWRNGFQRPCGWSISEYCRNVTRTSLKFWSAMAWFFYGFQTWKGGDAACVRGPWCSVDPAMYMKSRSRPPIRVLANCAILLYNRARCGYSAQGRLCVASLSTCARIAPTRRSGVV